MPSGEATGEVGGAFIAEFVGDCFDLNLRWAEEEEGVGHFQAQQAMMWGFMGEAFE